jgi:carbonic anhydrase/acetyltransferase-like protein (isoleucine patch superfamily)
MPNLLPTLILLTIWCGSMAIGALPLALMDHQGFALTLLGYVVAPILFALGFPTIAGLISRAGRKGIRGGKFPREAMHPVYLLRRIYGAAWTQVYYFKPLYAVILGVPFFKKYVLRLFGYKNSIDFVVYPDTWIRDLPLLHVGAGSYLSNRSTIGTNICLADGTIYVAPVKIGEKSLVGHLAMLAPGAILGVETEVGVGCAIGIKVRLRDKVSVKPSSSINHGAVLGTGVDVGAMSFLGLRCEISDGIKIPSGSNIPAGAVIQTQADVERYYSSETEMLKQRAQVAMRVASEHLADE